MMHKSASTPAAQAAATAYPWLAKKAEEDSQTIGNPRDVDARNYEKIYARAFEAGRHRKVARALAHAGS